LTEHSGWKTFTHQWGGGNAAYFTTIHFCHDMATGLMSAMLPLLRKDLELNYLETSLLVAVYSIISGAAQIPGGWLGDRAKRNVVAAIGLGGVGLAALGVSVSPTYSVILMFMAMMGVFGGFYHPSATSLLTSFFESGRRGTAIGLHLLGGTIGFTAGPVLGGIIGAALGWRFAFVLLSIPALVAVPIVIKKFTPRDQPELVKKAKAGDGPGVHEGKPRLLTVIRPVAAITLLAILVHLVAGASLAFIPLYLVDKHHVDPAYAAMLLGLIRGGGMFGSLFGGWLSDRWGRKNTVVMALAATGPLFYLITWLPFNPALMIVFVVFGAMMLTRQSAIQALLMDRTPARLRSTIFGIYFGLSQEGMSVTQPVVGQLMDLFGIVQVFHLLAIGSIALSVLVLIWAKMTRDNYRAASHDNSA
jgi:FSR family fosmidomycin resistance protein-like MFS transporter